MKRIPTSLVPALLVAALLALLAPGMAAAQTSGFTGLWTGQLSGVTVTLEVFDNEGLLNATTWFGGVKQNLEYLGYKASFNGHYFWREGDKAAVCLYFEGSTLVMTYFEKDIVRKVTLSPA
jgi:hypothetical protein